MSWREQLHKDSPVQKQIKNGEGSRSLSTEETNSVDRVNSIIYLILCLVLSVVLPQFLSPSWSGEKLGEQEDFVICGSWDVEM